MKNILKKIYPNKYFVQTKYDVSFAFFVSVFWAELFSNCFSTALTRFYYISVNFMYGGRVQNFNALIQNLAMMTYFYFQWAKIICYLSFLLISFEKVLSFHKSLHLFTKLYCWKKLLPFISNNFFPTFKLTLVIVSFRKPNKKTNFFFQPKRYRIFF